MDRNKLPTSLLSFALFFLKKQPIAFIFAFLMPCILLLETNVIPYAFKMIIDALSQYNTNRDNIINIIKPALIIGGLAQLSLVICIRLGHRLQAYLVPKMQADIRLTVLKELTKQSYSFFMNQMSGNLATKVNDLARSVENIRMIVTWNIFATSLTVIVAISIMATINITFSLIILSWVIINALLLIYNAKYVNAKAKNNAEDVSNLSGVIVDILSNILTVKLFSRNNFELNYAKNYQNKEQQSNQELVLATNYYRLLIDLPVTLMLAILVFFLIYNWRNYTISNGDFVFIFNSATIIITSIWHLSWSLTELFKEVGLAKQALHVIALPPKIIDKQDAPVLCVKQGLIEFNNVTFHYNNGAKIFNNKNITIYPGQRVGLVGFSGSGKSTFVNLILRFHNVESGIISIDHQDISKVTQDSLRSNISMIPQDTTLFHRSLLENIKYGKPEASFDEVLEASKKSHCHEFITKLDEQYNSLVGERGVKLSGGQRQRIAIARAILENAPILILDEATSALDTLTEQFIQESLLLLMQNRTTIVIAHRLSTLLHMDRILVFDNGCIIEDGTHQDLLNQSGHYAKLWRMQVEGFLPEK